MSATVWRFPGGDVIAEPKGDTVLRANAKQWLEQSLQHQIGGSNAINAGDDSTAVAELVHARNRLDRAITILIESRGHHGDPRRLALEALQLTLTAIAGEIELLPTGVAALTAHRLDVQADRLDNALARTQALASEFRAVATLETELTP